jgi:transcriptional regulator with XRE-family HTH domain
VPDADELASAWHALGRLLAASRRAAGLSQESLAALAGYTRSTVANVETGRQHGARDFWERCDTALDTGTALARGYDDVVAAGRLGRVRAAAEARQARAIAGAAVAVRGLEPVAVRLGLVIPAGAAEADGIELLRRRLEGALSNGAVSGTSLDAWEQAVLCHGQATRYRPSGELLIELGADMAELELAISGCRAPGSLRRLTRVAAQMAGLMCLLFVKLDEPDSFRRWARTARVAAGQAGDAVTVSWVLAQEAYGHYYGGDMAAAVNVARHAQGMMRRAPCAGAALAAAVEARARAARGDVRGTRSALGRAAAILAALAPGSVTASAFGYSESQFRFHEGSAYTRLGDTRSALRAQERALQTCPSGDYTDWALTRLDRASCLARDGDPVAAVAYATETLTGLSGEQSRGIIVSRGRAMVRALPASYRNIPAVRELNELLPAGGVKELP